MAIRISGQVIPDNKHVRIGLRQITGIGNTLALKVCNAAGVDYSKKVKELTEDEVKKLIKEIAKETTEGDLRREVAQNIKRLTDMGCTRGKRHRSGLPVRGQRTKTNARTRKGPKKGRKN